jgi:large subunit ribosomal protein L22
MSEETPEIEPDSEETKPRRRRRAKPEAASEAASASETGSSVSDADASPEAASDDEPEASTDVDPQAEGDQAPEAAEEPATEEKRKPRRRARKPAAEKAPDPPAAPAPSRRRRSREPGEPIPVVRAQAKYVRTSARKARLVCDHIRGKSVDEARAILAHTPRAVARDWSKLLESAVANAEHNHELVGEDLYVKAITADEGPTIKRFRPRAMGRATQIRKRTSHLTVLLTPKE